MAKTSQQLVTHVRYLLQLIEGNNKAYRDGFDSDVDQTLTPILQSLNTFLQVCSLTGCKTGDTNGTAAPDNRILLMNADMIEVYSVYYAGRPLTPTTRAALDAMDPAWVGETGLPTRYFREGNQIFLDKLPGDTASTFSIHGAFALTSFPSSNNTQALDDSVPTSAAERIAFGAAYLQGVMDADNPRQSARIAFYKSMADGVLKELYTRTSREDYAVAISMDNWHDVQSQTFGSIPPQKSLVSLPDAP